MKKRSQKLPTKWKTGDGSKEDIAMASIRSIHATGDEPTDAETIAAKIPLPRSLKEPCGAKCIERNGKIVWRIPSKAGADFDRHPHLINAIRAEQSYSTGINKIEREGRILQNSKNAANKSLEVRKQKAEVNEARVLQLAEKHTGAGRKLVSIIARKTLLSKTLIRKIIK